MFCGLKIIWVGPFIWGIRINNKSESAKLISKNGFGIVFGKNIDKIERHLMALLDGENHRTSRSSAANKTLEMYHRKVLAERMINLIHYK